MTSSNVAKAVASRAVHIRICPPPRDIHESKRLMQKLQEFGEIDSFRLLNADSNDGTMRVCLAIYRQEHSATSLLLQSPMQLEVSLQRRPNRGIFGMSVLQTEERHGSPSIPVSKLTNSAVEVAKQENLTRTFSLTIQPSKSDHYGHIRRQKYYWSFKPRITSISEDELNRKAPLSALATIVYPQSTILSRVVNQNMSDFFTRRALSKVWSGMDYSKQPNKALESFD